MLERNVADALRRLGHTVERQWMAKEWLENWLDNERGAIADGTFQKYAQVIRGFIRSLGPRVKTLKLKAITPEDCVRYRDLLLAGGRSASTVNYLVRSVLKRQAYHADLLES